MASKGKGKSGGARVITHFYVANNTVFLISIYDKSEQENIPNNEIKALLKLIQWQSHFKTSKRFSKKIGDVATQPLFIWEGYRN
ncbi:type II toxin-antitoxin system RelE/ParE family toxin [Schleiferia thermophila]|uniref:type II toxin-antitoxin system RelE/ParE family toxin n=1 Tax=Schleiferia thermophila TaxID=884107 RepID=UPI001FD35B7A|nr:type II toxin-antitoxin system RelE/ParE family toxin [Schleiferia thermophila]